MRENNIPSPAASHFLSVYLCVRMCRVYKAVLCDWGVGGAPTPRLLMALRRQIVTNTVKPLNLQKTSRNLRIDGAWWEKKGLFDPGLKNHQTASLFFWGNATIKSPKNE